MTLPSRGDIVDCLLAHRRALHAREIATRCHVSEAAYPRLLELLDQLSFDGAVTRMPGNRFKAQPVDERGGGVWEGVLSVNPRGFGFVVSAGHDDVYVAPDGIGVAMHGDTVRVKVIHRSSRGLEGRIEEVIARRNPRVAGVLRKRRKSAWLEPDDSRVRGPIVVTAGAKLGKDGEAAVVEILRFPSMSGENPEGELVAVLGAPGDPNAEVAKILLREEIVEEHPEEAVREAETMAARIQKRPYEKREDLREIPLVTIDPEDARDHDDAVWVERRGQGYRLWVAIADVSEYVQPGSALDAEAKERGCTIYLPDRAVPMLPTALASDLCSLLPDLERLCLCVVADVDKDGKVKRFDIVEGVMRSQAFLTYGGVARALGFTAEPPRSPQAEKLKRELKVVDELARKIRKRRMRRGALDFDLPEAVLQLDEETGAPVHVKRRTQDPGIKRAYQIVEEFMILANELVAQWLSKRRAPAIYRVHDKPDEEKLERLASIAEKLGVRFDLEQMLDPLGLTKWLRSVEEHPKKYVLDMLLLRSMKQAVYDIVNIGHFGLASNAYLHFTSPIRRYPDIEVHRAVKHLLRGGKPDKSESAIEALRASATAASKCERAAMEVEREVVNLYRALLMRDRIDDVLEGTVAGMSGAGLYVSLDDPFVDVLVRFESMGPDRYEATADELGVEGLRSGDVVMLGDRIVVSIEDVAVLRRTVYARRVPPKSVVDAIDGEPRRGRGRGRGRGRTGSPAAERGERRGRSGGKKKTTRKTGKRGRRR